jgi:dTDP-4-dehydrorhamnose reductase
MEKTSSRQSVLILGASGMLGNSFADLTNLLKKNFGQIFFAYHSNPKKFKDESVRSIIFEAGNKDDINKVLSEINPDVIANCAATTIVEDCQKNPRLAFEINATFPAMLAEWTNKNGKKLVHFSTDAVFDGKKPPLTGYAETDKPKPLNVYAKSKLEGEKLIQLADPNALILRINIIGIRGREPFPLAEWIIRSLASGQKISGFTDVFFAPLFTEDIVKLTLKALQNNLSGVYHLNAKNYVNKFTFAKLIAKEFRYNQNLIYPSTSVQKLSISRPLKTYLSSSAFTDRVKCLLPTVAQSVARLHQAIKNDKFRL